MSSVIDEVKNEKKAAKAKKSKKAKAKGRGKKPILMRRISLTLLCTELEVLCRQFWYLIRCKNSDLNRATHHLAVCTYGYSTKMDEKERKATYAKAQAHVTELGKGTRAPTTNVDYCVLAALEAALPTAKSAAAYKKRIELLASYLPVMVWVREANQRGFGAATLGYLIGEAGNLSKYAGPAKLWRRMGCAPFQSDGVMKMGSSWKREKNGLTKEEWTEFGYSPRRRAVAYVIGTNLVKSNQNKKTNEVFEYRLRYLDAREKAAVAHEDWKDGHSHNHGMLLCTKRLFRNTWREWRRVVGDDDPMIEVPLATSPENLVLAGLGFGDAFMAAAKKRAKRRTKKGSNGEPTSILDELQALEAETATE